MRLYDKLKDAGIVMDSHESDLYVPSSAEALKLIKEHGFNYSFFRSNIDGKLWIEVPFAYSPWWDERLANNPRSKA